MANAAWIHLLVYAFVLLTSEGLLVNITYVEDAVAKGSVCLDGSPPAYHLSPGFGSGVNDWLVHLEGGAWCHNVTTCLVRMKTRLGSSKQMEKQINFDGILSNDKASNPDFYNWNRVKIRYCDGSSFTGDVESVDPAANLHYRGGRVWLAVMEDLLAKGMSNAENALLSGCSAGGLSSIIHCDQFQSFFQNGARVKCLSDAGYFLDVKDITGTEYIKGIYHGVVTTHGSTKNLLSSCTSRFGPTMCFFPQYMVQLIETPLFILNSAYDIWQIANILVPQTADPSDTWNDCKFNVQKCSPTQLQTLYDFRTEFLDALASLRHSSSTGMFINSCVTHCQTESQETWFGAHSPLLDNTTIAEAVGDWFYDRNSFQRIDYPYPYPCNNSCPISPFDGKHRSYNIQNHPHSDSLDYPFLTESE